MTNINWTPLVEEAQLETIDEISQATPCLIFKHSTRCSISSVAKNRLEKHWKFSDDVLPAYYLDLISYRNVSNTIASRYGIRHESPQVLLIKDGRCIYSGSHFEIGVDELQLQIS